MKSKTQFKNIALGLLVYTILVILWGAWVRISHSGDGCGDTWPLCHGQLIPEAQRGKTWVEYGHRLMSGIYGFYVIYFYVVARKLFPKGHFARKAALLTLIFMITEALLGAKLVLFGLVASNDTPYRAFVMALHQLNSFMLTGAVTLAYGGALLELKLPKAPKLSRAVQYFPLIIVVLGITGAWASLSNSLFPAENLFQGFLDDFNTESHFLVRLRVIHPFLAILGGGSLALFFWIKSNTAENVLQQRRAWQMALLLIFGICFGLATLLLHAPTWMKVVHLCLAHLIWVTLIQWVLFMKQEKEFA